MDVTIIREISRDAGVTVKWAPGDVQVADGLTKEREDVSTRLRGAMRTGRFQLAEEGEALRQMKRERELREERKKLKADIEAQKTKQANSTVTTKTSKATQRTQQGDREAVDTTPESSTEDADQQGC